MTAIEHIVRRCQKCGQTGTISPPRFEEDAYGERLVRQCFHCGHLTSGPTADHKKDLGEIQNILEERQNI